MVPKHLFDVLCLLVVPTQCNHPAIERYFEWDNYTPGSCINMCSYCCGHVANLDGKFYRRQLEGFLTGLFSSTVSLTPDEMKKGH